VGAHLKRYLAIAAVSLLGGWSWSSYENVDECVHSEMKNGSREDLRVTRDYCDQYFKEQHKRLPDLPYAEVQKIQGSASYLTLFNNMLSINIYNGTAHHLRYITISVHDDAEKTDNPYVEYVDIPQNTSSTVTIQTLPPKGAWTWGIISAKGD